MAIRRGILNVIKNSLVRGRDSKDIFQYISGFPGGYAERDVEGEYKAEGIERISDIKDELGFIRWGVSKLFIGKMVVSELVTKFELRRFEFL